MRLALTHAVLLVAALGFAYQTWTRDEGEPAPPGSVVLWNESPGDLASITYEDQAKRVVLEWRRDEQGRYLWGTVTRTAAPGDHADPMDHGHHLDHADAMDGGDHGDHAAALDPAGAAATGAGTAAAAPPVVFVVGETGDQLVRQAAAPRGRRDLGLADPAREQEYGLTNGTARITVDFGRRTRELQVGGTAWATRDRYVREPASGRVYVLPDDLIRSLEDADRVLPERRLHEFGIDRVGSVSVRTPRGERTMQKGGSPAAGPTTWAAPSTPDQPDQTFANFMNRVAQLWIVDYPADLDRQTLSDVLRVDYFDANGRAIGHLTLYRRTGGEAAEYFIETERTRVPARIYEATGEQLDQDVAQLL